jgi:hypothetical protein
MARQAEPHAQRTKLKRLGTFHPAACLDRTVRRGPVLGSLSLERLRSWESEDAQDLAVGNPCNCRCAVLADWLAAGCDDEPEASEVRDVLALDLARFRVFFEVVQRMLRVGHLERSVAAPGRTQKLGVDAREAPRRTLGQERRPCLRARARAAAVPAVSTGSRCFRQPFTVGRPDNESPRPPPGLP